MAADRKKPSKSESLTIRMDPKTKFVIDFISKVRGQSITTVVERAIMESANSTKIPGDPFNDSWGDFWDVEEGVRYLKMASCKELYPSFDDEMILDFTRVHWQFFYTDRNFSTYRRGYICILWPRINEFVELWHKTRTSDYFAAGERMREALSAAGIAAPEWPPKAAPAKSSTPPPPPPPPPPINKELDDDIPF